MELRDYLTVLRKYWISIVAVTLAGVAVAALVSLLTRPTYTAQTAVFLSVQGGDSAGELLQGANYATSQVRSYAQVVSTPVVLQPVIDRLGLQTTPAELARSVTTSIPLNTAVIEIAVVSADPVLSASLAQQISEQLVATVESLSPVDSSGARTVVGNIVTPATVPTEWTSPRVMFNLAAGLLLGLVLGVGQALLRNVLDLSVRTEEDVARATDHAVIVKVPLDPDAAEHPLVMHSDPHSLRAEAYRRLRTNLQFLDAGGTSGRHAFVVTSSVPGEGKTTTAINIASTLAEGGESVLLIDADLRRPQVASYLNLEGAVGLTTILIGRATLEDVVQPVGQRRLGVLPSGQLPPNPAELLGSEAMKRLLSVAAQSFDTIVIDSAPLLPVTDAAVLSTLTGGALVVAGSGDVTVPELEDSVAALDQVGGRTLGIVLNKTRATDGNSYHYYHQDVERPASRTRLFARKDASPARSKSGRV